MGSGFQFFDIIILAAVAAFLIFRLRSVLGRRSGNDDSRPRYDPFRKDRSEEANDDKVIQLPDRGQPDGPDEQVEPGVEQDKPAKSGTPLDDGLTQIKLADRNFDDEGFLGGSKAAFEMILSAFAAGDTKTLRPLLSNDVFEDFSGAIKAREEASETLETTLVGFKDTQLIEAELQGKTAFLTVKFVSEQINVTRDDQGGTVDGDPSQVATITDIWTFARNTRSRDPNWTLVATRSPN